MKINNNLGRGNPLGWRLRRHGEMRIVPAATAKHERRDPRRSRRLGQMLRGRGPHGRRGGGKQGLQAGGRLKARRLLLLQRLELEHGEHEVPLLGMQLGVGELGHQVLQREVAVVDVVHQVLRLLPLQHLRVQLIVLQELQRNKCTSVIKLYF